MRRYIFLLLFILGFSQLTKAQDDIFIPPTILSDSAEVSLLTSTPWDGQIYALFGHTALRVKDPVNEFDGVFNYGVFDFSSPNFTFRFIKGETDYMVQLDFFSDYFETYKKRGVSVIEQVINLTQKEKQDIYTALIINAHPKNRIYRYNYFYDNCSTRPRDMIEKYIEGKIEYVPTNKEQTYRDLVHECLVFEPWVRFGIDLIIGADADKIITDRQKDFLPLYLLKAFDKAKILSGTGDSREMVAETNVILESLNKEYAHAFLETVSLFYPSDYPLYSGCLLLVIAILISYFSYKAGKFGLAKLFDTLLFLLAGFGGCIIFFLMFFSEHPCVNPNWNIIWLNPLQLIIALLFFVKSLSKYLIYYHFINFVALLLFLMAWCLIPQQLEIAFIPYILVIALRSVMNIVQQRKTKKKADYSLPKAK